MTRAGRALVLLPLLGLTACAGSQRFVGQSPTPVGGGPVYNAPPLQPAPPITSGEVTAQPLPPPGGYPVAAAPPPGLPSAPPSTGGALPPPTDPFFDPNAGRAPVPAAPETLQGGGGQIATLGQGQASGRPPVTSRDGIVGSWTAREATGGSCRVTLSSSPTLDLYRASSAGCANGELQRVNAWDYRGGEVYLYQPGGTVVARLRASDGGSMNGAVTKSGAGLSMSR